MKRPVKPLVAISRCLLGDPVRYDGRSRRDDFIVKTLSAVFEWAPVCPEVAIGLGTPRPPIRLVSRQDGVHVEGVDDPTRDVTGALAAYARRFAEAFPSVRGCILKARSPSCGLGGLPVFSANGDVVREDGVGEFARVLSEFRPGIPCIDEERLRNAQQRDAFVRNVLRATGNKNGSLVGQNGRFG